MNRCEEKEPDYDGMDHEYVEQYLSDLIPELNLRLLCEREADQDVYFPSDKVFWIEGITILSYRPGIYHQRIIRDCKATEVSKRLLERIVGWIKNRLTELRGKAHSLRP